MSLDRAERLRTAHLLERQKMDKDTSYTSYSGAVALRRLHIRFVMALRQIQRQGNKEVTLKELGAEGLRNQQGWLARYMDVNATIHRINAAIRNHSDTSEEAPVMLEPLGVA